MLRRFLRFPLLLLTLMVACTGESATTTGLAAATTTTTEARTIDEIGDLPGRLVVLDEAGNIVTIDPDGSDPTQITDDAGDEAAYRQPTFSPVEDLLTWAELRSTGFGLGFSDGAGQGRTLAETVTPPFFTYWSPDGTGVATLHNTAQGGSIELEVVDAALATGRVLATGSPLYLSWSPDSSQLAVHVEFDVFATLDLEGGTENLGETARGYQAPHWLSGGILHLAERGLELRQVDGTGRLMTETPGPVAFVANPQGTMVAIQAFGEEQPPGISAAMSPIPPLPSNRVVVIDIESGDLSEVTTSPAIGLFWSPDGEKLLALVPGEEGSGMTSTLVWRDGEGTELSPLVPHPAFAQEVLQFFDQYGQSLRLWSPDSAAFALAGAIGEEPGIWVYTIAGGDPIEVYEGSWVSWSS